MDVIDRLVADLALPPEAGPAHGMLVVLPLSLLVLAALAELLKRDSAGWRPGTLARLWLILGALTCLPVVLTGLTQALDRELGGEALAWHRLAGLTLTGLALVTWLFCWIASPGTRPRATGTYRLLLFATGVLAASQLWWGAALAHGTERFEQARRAPRLVSAPAVVPSAAEVDSRLPEPSAADAASIAATLEQLLAAGAMAGRVAQDSAAVEVDLGRLGPAADDGLVASLVPLAPVLLWLDLGGSAVTSEGLSALSGLTALERLDLSRTSIDDGGLVHLAGLRRLVVLNLHGAAVGDDGLERLAGLPALRRVYLWQTAVTDAGVARLQARRPDLTVVRGSSLPPVAEG